MFTERRKHPRSRVLRRGTIVFRKGYSTMPCVLLDLSPAGAQIKVDDWMTVPDSFELRIIHGPFRMAKVRHRALFQAGLEFIDTPDKDA